MKQEKSFVFKKLSTAFLVIAVLLGLTAISSLAFAEDGNNQQVPVATSQQQLQNLINNAPTGSQYTIGVQGNLATSANASAYGYTIPTGKNIRVVAVNGNASITGSNASNSAFDVKPGAKLTLGGAGNVLTITNFSAQAGQGQSGGAVYAEKSSTLELLTNVVLTGNRAQLAGGAVYTEPGASFVLDGATLTNNWGNYAGGAIFIAGVSYDETYGGVTFPCLTGSCPTGSNARFISGNISNNGTLSGRFTSYGGGIATGDASTIYMYDAFITQNHAVNASGASYPEAQGNGGGIAYCYKGSSTTQSTAFAAIYGNTADKAGDDITSPTKKANSGAAILVSNNALGKAVSWVEDGKLADAAPDSSRAFGIITDTNRSGNAVTTPLTTNKAIALKAQPSNELKNAAAKTVMRIDNNSARIGGGISANGTIVFEGTPEEATGNVSWSKVSAQNTSLRIGGSQWNILKDGKVIGSVADAYEGSDISLSFTDVNTAAGAIQVNGLAPGKYQLVETVAPAGYVLDSTPISFTVASNKTTTVFSGNNVTSSSLITNQPVEKVGEVPFEKYDEAGNLLAGATFNIYENKNGAKGARVSFKIKQNGSYDNSPVVTQFTSTKGTIYLQLPVGDYILEEVNPPAGYEKAVDVNFTVLETGKKYTTTHTDPAQVPTGDNVTTDGSRFSDGKVSSVGYCLNSAWYKDWSYGKAHKSYPITDIQKYAGQKHDNQAQKILRVLYAGVEGGGIDAGGMDWLDQWRATQYVITYYNGGLGKYHAGVDRWGGKNWATWVKESGYPEQLEAYKNALLNAWNDSSLDEKIAAAGYNAAIYSAGTQPAVSAAFGKVTSTSEEMKNGTVVVKDRLKPSLKTTASAYDAQTYTDSGIKMVNIGNGENIVITDKVDYTNLWADQFYVLKGELHLVSSDSRYDGQLLATKYGMFKAQNTNGTVKLNLELNANTKLDDSTTVLDRLKAGDKVVVYEYAYVADSGLAQNMGIDLANFTENDAKKGDSAFASDIKSEYKQALENSLRGANAVASHAVHADQDQTVVLPYIGTTATDKTDGDHNIAAKASVTVVDEVAYTNLIPGKTYTLTGRLVDKATGETVRGARGYEITASRTFTPQTANGKVSLEFNLDASNLEGKTLVAFERVTLDKFLVAVHEDINDTNQTVVVSQNPKISTTATDSETGAHIANGDDSVVIKDVVAYQNLVAGKEYTVSGTLMVKETGAPVRDAKGNAITATQKFTPNAANGNVTITFPSFDARSLQGKTVVVFEKLYSGTDTSGTPEATHEDINDEGQSVVIPQARTTATDKADGDHTLQPLSGKVTIVDRVTYTNLIAGKQYTVAGTLHDKATGEALKIAGATASKTFTAEKANGYVDIEFTIDASALAGKTLVAFEEVKFENKTVAVHADINDEAQTIYVPSIGTFAVDSETGDQIAYADSQVVINDLVSYKNLQPGKTYTLTGRLVDKATGETVRGARGYEITATKTFVASAEGFGFETIEFKMDASLMKGKTVVAFERLTLGNALVAVHEDINDSGQTILFPEVKTTATDKADGDHTVAATGKVTIVDRVAYTNLLPGRTYFVSGTLHDKETGDALEIEGATASRSFTLAEGDARDGYIDLEFTIDASALAGKAIVAFETVTYNGKDIAVHADINDENQTVYVPSLKTTATGRATQEHIVPGANVNLKDVVEYTNLNPGTTYTLEGTVMVKETGKPLEVEGKTVTASRTFTPQTANGTVELDFSFNASAVKGKTLVVFERVLKNGNVEVTHEDINDAAQTVVVPDIRTHATDKEDGNQVLAPESSVTVVDEVSYTNLLPGKEYTVNGTLMNKATGKALVVDGKEVKASRTFTPAASSGSITLEFTFKASALSGQTLVVFESLKYNNIEVAVHADINDEAQTVTVGEKPEIGTTATDSDTKEHIANADESVTIDDVVKYERLTPGKTYTLKGELVKKSDSSVIATAEKTFTPSKADGEETLSFTFNGSALAGDAAVAFERLYKEGEEVAVHADINDTAQTVEFPEVKTTATDKADGDHRVTAEAKVTIVDRVTYTNLIPGKEYTVSGALHDKATGKALDIAGATASKKFTAAEANGYVDIEFTIDASALGGKKVVAFETVTYEGKTVGVHADINDEAQTVEFDTPEIGTTATDSETRDHIANADDSITINDVVAYKNLTPGKKYTLSGTLMDKETGKALVVDGKEVTASREFTPSTANGNVTLSFTFKGSALAGKTLVAFEKVAFEGEVVAVHEDINDNAQTVVVPNVKTNATDKADGDHTVTPGKVTIVDRVTYTNLIPGKEYTVAGTLHDKATGEKLNVEGASASVTFTAEQANGYVDLEFTIDASALAGKALVAFEEVKYEGKTVGVHADINDEEQTVYVAKIATVANDAQTRDHIASLNADGTITINDLVKYEGLVPGKSYTLNGTVMVKETGKALVSEGKEVTASAEFVASETGFGATTLSFTFNADDLQGKTLVVFEKVSADNKVVATHEDINDVDQSVVVPSVRTTATDNLTGEKEVTIAEKAQVKDVVTYTNLVPGKKYTLSGTLMNKETGKALVVNGKEVTASKEFTPSAANGTVELVFEFDSRALEGQILVAFETVTYNGIEVAVHADINDEAQTVVVKKTPRVGTTATADETGEHIVKAQKDVVITDVVAYENLKPGTQYTLIGTLVKKSNGDSVAKNERTFTPDTENGTVELTFTVDTTSLAGESLVAFEQVVLNGDVVASHEDINDEAQTVVVPSVKTNASDASDGDKSLNTSADGDVKVKDVVTYSNLLIGKEYTVNGTLMDKATGKPFVVDGKEVTASKTFTATEANGSVELEFTVKASALAGKTLVVFESVLFEGKEVAVHADLTDKDQTVYGPKIGTTATDKETGTHLANANDSVITINDVVAYEGLIPGASYKVSGTLMDKETGNAVKVDDKPLTSNEVTFVAGENGAGSVSVAFTIDTAKVDVAGKTFVAFEKLFEITGDTSKEVAVHEDINDEAQTVVVPSVKTNATDKETGTQIAHADADVTIIDRVTYTNLIPGKEYTVSGTLHEKINGENGTVVDGGVLKDADGKAVEASITFTPEEANGYVDLSFTFNGSLLAGKTVVAFETVTFEGKTVGVHADINDKEQSVEFPKAATSVATLTDVPKSGEVVTITDTIAYSGLIPGQTYTLVGKLVNKFNGEVVSSNVKKTFTPDASNGTVDMELKVDADAIINQDLYSADVIKTVAFEKVYLGDFSATDVDETKLVASHEDIDSPEQTAQFSVKSTPTTRIYKSAYGIEDAALKGATLQIQDENGNPVKVGVVDLGLEDVTEWVTSGHGDETISLPDYGNYVLVELAAPEGYQLADPVKFTVDRDGTKVDGLLLDDGMVRMVDMPITKEFIFSKYEIGGSAELPGAVLKVTGTDFQGNTFGLQWTSTRVAREFVLRPGTYVLEEVSAPAGYDLAEPVSFEVKMDGTLYYHDQNQDSSIVRMYDAKTPTGTGGGGGGGTTPPLPSTGVGSTVPSVSLPITGLPTTGAATGIALGVAALLFLAGGVLLRLRYSKKES